MDILLAVQRYGIELVEKACRQALVEGPVRGEIIINTVARYLDPHPVDTAMVPDSLAIAVEPIADCSRYDSLRSEVQHGTP